MAEPEKGSPSRLREALRFSTATWAAIAVGAMLLMIMLVAWGWYSADASRVAWGSYMTWPQALMLASLWLCTCVLTYWTVRFWMHQPPVGDRALRTAWEQGRSWLASHSIGMGNTPVYLVLGCWSRHMQTRLFSTGLHAPEPKNESEPAIDWHATDEGIFIVLRNVGVYNRLLQKLRSELPNDEANGDAHALMLARGTASGEVSAASPMGEHGVQVGVPPQSEAEASKHESYVTEAHESTARGDGLNAVSNDDTDETVEHSDSDQHLECGAEHDAREDDERTANTPTNSADPEQPATSGHTSGKVDALADEEASNSDDVVGDDDAEQHDEAKWTEGATEVHESETRESKIAASGTAGAAVQASVRAEHSTQQSMQGQHAKPGQQMPVMPTEAESVPAFQTLERVESLVEQARLSDGKATAPHATTWSVVPRVDLNSRERTEAQSRLETLCTLLMSSRQPAAAINGTLVLVEPERLYDEATSRRLGRAVRDDLDVISEELGLHSPVTTLVAGLEDTEPFRELARRSLRESTLSLGSEFDAQQIPEPAAVCQLVDRAIDDACQRIDHVLGQPESLSQPGNHHLVRLAIRCRGWRRKLQWVLVEACGAFQPVQPRSPILTGLFFSGASGDRRLRSWHEHVLNHMHDEQHHLMWNSETVRAHRTQQRLVWGLYGLLALLSVTAIGQLIW